MLILLWKQKLPIFQKNDGIFKDFKVNFGFVLYFFYIHFESLL